MEGKKNFKGFGMIHLNIRSYMKHKDEIQLSFQNYDIIAITETWLSPMISDRFIKLESHNLLRQDRNRVCTTGRVKKGGGIVVHVKTALAPYIDVLYDLCKNDCNSEEFWFRLEKPGMRKMIICVVYRPPSGSVPTFTNGLDISLHTLLGRGNPGEKELYILGDLNIDYLKRNRDVDKMRLKEIEEKFNIHQIIKTPTRVTTNTKSLIDLILTTVAPNLIHDSGVLKNPLSDHLPVYIIRKKKREHTTRKTIVVRDMSMYNVENLAYVLKDDIRWETFWNGALGIDAMWELMVKIFTETLECICPWKRIKIRDGQPEWFDGELFRAVKEKGKQYKIASCTKNTQDWVRYKTSRKKVQTLIISKKRNYILTKLNENRNVPKKFWKEIQNNLHFGNEKTVQLITIKDIHGKIRIGKDAAEPINTHYAGVGHSLAVKFQTTWDPSHCLCNFTQYPKMNFRFVGTVELTSLINCLNVNKSSSVHGIKTTQLKDFLKIMIIEFTHLINECLDHGIMPRSWSIGTVSPIPKNGNSQSMSDYRPISVLPSPSKIIERAVYNQLIYHLESHGMLDWRQHGFRKDHSTCTAIFELTQYLYNSLDNRKFVSCVFIDYSKAFDTIDHDILCKKLSHYGLGRDVLDWCKDYFAYRKQCVKIENVSSGKKDMKYGVPQGSILGPLFFIIYVNDLLSLFDQKTVQILLYADDTVVYFAHEDPHIACTTVVNALSKIQHWCNQNKLTINTKKTKHMLVAPTSMRELSPQIDVKMGDTTLDNVAMYCYLGVIIDNALTFNEFLKGKCDKINLRLYQLIKMRKYITSDIACTIYKQVILPLMDYADFLIGSGPAYYIKQLGNLHEKALRLIDCMKHKKLDASGLERLLKLESPKRRRYQHHCAFMYRLSKKGGSLDMYRPTIRLRSRNKIKFKVQKRNLEGILKSPLYRGIKLWDMIPESVQRSTTKVKFKSNLKGIPL